MSNQYNCGIYKITNIVNGKVYIGGTEDFKRRFKHHIVSLNGQFHRNEHLQRAWNKYGKDSFKFEPIYCCNKQDLDSSEIFFINTFNAMDRNYGYNMKLGGSSTRGINHPSYGVKVPEERKQKIRDARAEQPVTQAMLDALMKYRKDFTGITGKDHSAFGCKHSKESIERTAKAKWKAVLQIDPLTNKVVNKYNSIKEAAEKMQQKSHANISSCCKGNRKTVAGFVWKFEE